MSGFRFSMRSQAYTQLREYGFHGGEVRRYLRLAGLAPTARKCAALLRQAREHGRRAWHMAEALERAGK